MAITRLLFCRCCGDSAAALLDVRMLEFSDYAHQDHSITGDGFAETVISQWAWNSIDVLGFPFDVFLQLIMAFTGTDGGVRYRLREGGTVDAPDGKILLESAILAVPQVKTRACFSALDKGPDEGPCDLLKLTIEGFTGGAGPFTATTSGIHIDLKRPT